MQAAQQQFLRERNKKSSLWSYLKAKAKVHRGRNEEKKKKKAISKGIHTLPVIFYRKKNNSGGYWHSFLYKLQILYPTYQSRHFH